MAIAVAGAACLVFLILGLLVYRAVASSAGQTTQARVVVDLVLEDLAQAAREKQAEITLEGCLQRLPGSPEVLYLLIRNLLENSIRHVGERGRSGRGAPGW